MAQIRRGNRFTKKTSSARRDFRPTYWALTIPGVDPDQISLAAKPDGSRARNRVERLQIRREFVEGLGATDVEPLRRLRVMLRREVE